MTNTTTNTNTNNTANEARRQNLEQLLKQSGWTIGQDGRCTWKQDN